MSGPDDEPRALAVDLLSQILSYVKQSTPTRTDGTATHGYVYSVLRVGQMISPADYAAPWSPIGGTAAAKKPTAQQPPSDPTAAATAAAAKAAADADARRAMSATFNTEQLVDTMLVVTNDGTFETYSGGGRHLAAAYSDVLQAMQPVAPPPRPAEEQKRLDAASAVLYTDDGTNTVMYDRYLANQLIYANAQSNYATRSDALLSNPDTVDTAEQQLQPDAAEVQQALDRWRTQGADQVEAALATIESMGIPLEQGAIKEARDLLQAWTLPVAGVAGAKEPYSFVLPSSWAAFDVDDSGWTDLTIDRSSYSSHFDDHGNDVAVAGWHGESESTAGHVGVSVLGFGFNGSYSESHTNSGAESGVTGSNGSTFHNDAKDMHIELQYGLCQIARPWLISDLFRMQNWFLVGQRAGCISSGIVDDQVGSEKAMLPMFPTHFLAVRNVTVRASDWGTDGQTLATYYATHDTSSQQHSSTVGGNVEVPVLGPLCLDAGASHSENGYGGSYHDATGHSFSNDYKAHFDGTTLTIRGTQIMAWLSEVVPRCPPLDDPALPKPTT